MMMMNDQIRRPEQVSPKSSPRGSRSPAYPKPTDSSGTLKTTISLGKVPSVIHSGPFYLMKDIPLNSEKTEITGCTNLVEFYDLEHTYNKFCNKKGKEELSSFLPNLPGYIDAPGIQDNSSLRSLIEKPPITGKELNTLSNSALTGFRLHPGPLPEQYRFMSQMPQKKKHKHKRKKETGTNGALQEASAENTTDGAHEQKKKKTSKNPEEASKSESSGKKDSGRKKKKKNKKKGKEKDDDPQS